jgi:hypothetical protein
MMTPGLLARVAEARADSPPSAADTIDDLLTVIDRLAAENRDLRAKLAAFADGRPTIYREPGGPTP